MTTKAIQRDGGREIHLLDEDGVIWWEIREPHGDGGFLAGGACANREDAINDADMWLRCEAEMVASMREARGRGVELRVKRVGDWWEWFVVDKDGRHVESGGDYVSLAEAVEGARAWVKGGVR